MEDKLQDWAKIEKAPFESLTAREKAIIKTSTEVKDLVMRREHLKILFDV